MNRRTFITWGGALAAMLGLGAMPDEGTETPITDARQRRLEQGKELMERLASGTPYPHSQRHMDALRDVIVRGEGEIYYIDRVNGHNLNDGLSMATAWKNRQAIRGEKPGDVLVIDGYVFIRQLSVSQMVERMLGGSEA